MVPVSFWWAGTYVWFSTPSTNPTGRNLIPSGAVSVSLGHPQDVVLIEGRAGHVPTTEMPPAVAEGIVAKCRWDPRNDHPSYTFFHITPHVLRAWGTDAEMTGRTLMRDGSWLL
jgi:hypothetical protein